MAADQPAAVLTWTGISNACAVIGQQVSADGIPDVIVGVIRGGMIPAVLLSTPSRPAVTSGGISLACTQSEGVNAAKAPRPVLANPGSAGQVTGLDVLIADDVAGAARQPRPPPRCYARQGARADPPRGLRGQLAELAGGRPRSGRGPGLCRRLLPRMGGVPVGAVNYTGPARVQVAEPGPGHR